MPTTVKQKQPVVNTAGNRFVINVHFGNSKTENEGNTTIRTKFGETTIVCLIHQSVSQVD